MTARGDPVTQPGLMTLVRRGSWVHREEEPAGMRRSQSSQRGRDVSIEKETVRTLLKRPVVVVDPDATLRQVAETLADDYIGVAVVRATPPKGPGTHAEGVISERDIIRALAEGADPDIERAENVMTLDIATAGPRDTIVSVAECMLENEIRHVPVTDDGVVVGVVSERDALRIFVAEHQSARQPS
jgi:CBS domain-containing protein